MTIKTQSTSLFLSVSFRCIFYYSVDISVDSISLIGNSLMESAIISVKMTPNSSCPSLTASLALMRAVVRCPTVWDDFPLLQGNLFKIETLISIPFTIFFSNSTFSPINGA